MNDTGGVDDSVTLSSRVHEAHHKGVSFKLRCYIDSLGRERLIWVVDDSEGNDARVDIKNSQIHLPQGHEISVDGSKQLKFDIPRWLADALLNKFHELHQKEISLGDIDSVAPQTREVENVTPILRIRAYRDENRNRRLIWQRDGYEGRKAILDNEIHEIRIPMCFEESSHFAEGGFVQIEPEESRTVLSDLKSL